MDHPARNAADRCIPCADLGYTVSAGPGAGPAQTLPASRSAPADWLGRGRHVHPDRDLLRPGGTERPPDVGLRVGPARLDRSALRDAAVDDLGLWQRSIDHWPVPARRAMGHPQAQLVGLSWPSLPDHLRSPPARLSPA